MRLLIVLLSLCSLAFGQGNADAGRLRGKNIKNPLTPLDRQGLGWDDGASAKQWTPMSFVLQNGQSNYCVSASGSTTTYTCNLSPSLNSYTAGLIVAWKPDLVNTGASTLNINSVGAVAINKLSSGALVAVGAGDISNQYIYLIRYNGSVWILESAGSGGGAGGGCAVSRTSGTVLTLLSDASVSNTCITGLQNAVYTFSAPATCTISAGTGDAFFYVTSAGVLTCGHSGLTVVCSGCTVTPGITAFPQGVAKLYQWHATAAVWDSTGTDSRVDVQGDPLTAGSGITLATTSGATTISADCTSVVTSFTGAGAPGSIASSCLGSDYLNTTNGDKYVCNNAGGGCTSVAAGQWVIVTGGAGAGGINITREETSAIAMTGSDVDIYSVSVPALAAGRGCRLDFAVEPSAAASVQMKVKFGSDTFSAAGAITALNVWKQPMLLYNIQADNTHQRLVTTKAMTYENDVNEFQNFTYVQQTFTQNWGSAVTLKIVANSGTGGATVTGRYFSLQCP